MFKKLLIVAALIVGISASACWFTEANYNRDYIARINTAYTFYCEQFRPDLIPTWTNSPIACPPAGTQDLPAQIWIKMQPRSEGGSPNIDEAILQYKKLPSGTWVTFKDLKTTTWVLNYSSPVQLFGPNVFDPPGAKTGDQYLVRMYFTDGLYENAALTTDTSGAWDDTVWRNQWVVKITIGKRRPL